MQELSNGEKRTRLKSEGKGLEALYIHEEVVNWFRHRYDGISNYT
jgi:hypothetical protein